MLEPPNSVIFIKNNMDNFKRTSACEAQPTNGSPAFTLTELAVVIATVAVLFVLLLPALAGTKVASWRTECAANMRQIGTGLVLYTTDHNNKYPPACYFSSGNFPGVSWDTCINRYLGGSAPLSALTANNLATQYCLSVLWCPADRAPKTDPTGTYTSPWAGARRSYAENGTSTPAPQRNGDTFSGYLVHGVGAYVQASDANSVNLDPPGWKTSIVRDPAGTIQIAEMPTYKSIQGNNWASFCAGPDWNNHQPLGADQYCYQVDSSQASLNPAGGGCYGGDVYRLQANRFNYLFHDGHVQLLKYTDTIGKYAGSLNGNWSAPLNTNTVATTGNPGGMWTARKGD